MCSCSVHTQLNARYDVAGEHVAVVAGFGVGLGVGLGMEPISLTVRGIEYEPLHKLTSK